MSLLTGAVDVMRRPQMRRRALAMADQGVSSLSNVVVAVLVARAFGGPAHFGAFSLAMVAYQIVLGSLRALVGEPLLSLYSHETSGARRKLAADLHATTLFLGVLCSLALWLVSVWVGDLSGSALLALAVVLPVLLMHDTWRFLFIVDRPGAALAIDGLWLLAVVVAMALAPADASVAWFVVAWGLAGGLGALLGVVLGGRLPGRPHPWRWLVAHRTTSLRFLGEFITARSSSQFVLIALGAIAGLSALGAAKASLVYFGLLNTLHMGLYLAVVPEGAQSRGDPAKLRRLMTGVGLGLVGLAAVWMVAGLVVPDRWGREFLGSTWHEAEPLMLPMGLAMIAGGIVTGGFLGLRSLGDSRRSFAARMHSTLWQSVCPLVGAVVGGAMGFAIGFAVGRAAAALVWVQAFRQGLDEAGDGEPAVSADGDQPEPSIEAAREEVVLG